VKTPPRKRRQRSTQDVSVCRHGPLAPPSGVCPCERDCYCRDPKASVAVVQKPCDPGAPTFWITRDSEPDGSLSDYCDLWVVKPSRLRYDADGPGGFWMGCEGEWSLVGHYETVSVEVVRTWFHVVPDTSRECIRVW
jgi:hypothetical protein